MLQCTCYTNWEEEDQGRHARMGSSVLSRCRRVTANDLDTWPLRCKWLHPATMLGSHGIAAGPSQCPSYWRFGPSARAKFASVLAQYAMVQGALGLSCEFFQKYNLT